MHCDARGVSISYDNDRRGRFNYDPLPKEEKSHNSELKLSPAQLEQYNKLLYESKPEFLQSLSYEAYRIHVSRYKRAQFALKKLKYQAYFGIYDRFLNEVFRRMGLRENRLLGLRTMDYNQVPPGITLAELKIKKEQIIAEFIACDLLPADFLQQVEPSV